MCLYLPCITCSLKFAPHCKINHCLQVSRILSEMYMYYITLYLRWEHFKIFHATQIDMILACSSDTTILQIYMKFMAFSCNHSSPPTETPCKHTFSPTYSLSHSRTHTLSFFLFDLSRSLPQDDDRTRSTG